MEDSFGYMYLNNMPQWRLKIIDGYISIYFYIINPPQRLDTTNQENNLEAVIGDIDSDCLGAKEERNNIVLEVSDQINNKA